MCVQREGDASVVFVPTTDMSPEDKLCSLYSVCQTVSLVMTNESQPPKDLVVITVT